LQALSLHSINYLMRPAKLTSMLAALALIILVYDPGNAQPFHKDTAAVANLLNKAQKALEEPEKDLPKAWSYHEDALQLAHQIQYIKGQADVYFWENKFFKQADSSVERRVKSLQTAANLYSTSKAYALEAECYTLILKLYTNKGKNNDALNLARAILARESYFTDKGKYTPIFQAYYSIGLYHRRTLNIDSSNLYFKHALSVSTKGKIDYNNAYIYYTYNLLSGGKYGEAILLNNELKNRSQRDNNLEGQMWASSNLGTIYGFLKSPRKAQEAYQEALRALSVLMDTKTDERYPFYAFEFRIAAAMHHYTVYPSRAAVDTLALLYQKAKQLAPCNFWGGEDLITFYADQGAFTSALDMSEVMLQQCIACTDTLHYTQVLAKKAAAMMKKGDYNHAKIILYKINTLKQNITINPNPDLLELQARLAIASGKYQKGEMLFEQSMAIKDSLEQKRLESIAYLAASLEQEQQQKEILHKDNIILRSEKSIQQLTAGLLLLITSLMLIILIIWGIRLRYMRQVQSVNIEIEQQLDELVQNIIETTDALPVEVYKTIRSQITSMLIDKTKENSLKALRLKLQKLRTVSQQQNILNKKIKELGQTREKALRSFNYTVSHDLKAPLSNAQHFIDLMLIHLRIYPDPIIDNYLKHLHTAIENMKSLIEGIRNYAQTDTIILNYQIIDVNEILESIIYQLTPRYPDASKLIHCSILPKIWGDPFLIRQLFTNLLDNALKFSQQSLYPKIQVSGEKNAEFTKISICDNGAGFDPSAATRIFELFYSAHDRNIFAGSGVGLAIVRRIVERHHGKITAANLQNGTGAIFEIFFPSNDESIYS